MQKKKAAERKGTSKKPVKKRLQKVNKTEEYPSPRYLPEGALNTRKAVCANAECKLRRAGCYGYEGCPGFKGRG